MKILHRLRALRTNLFFRAAVDRDLHDELASYVQLKADELRASGAVPDQADRQARIALGGAAAVSESVRSSRTGAGLERTWQDVTYAVRGLRRAPGYAVMAILTLALGLGANAAVFSVVDAAMFKPLPYRDADRLVLITQVFRRGTQEQTTQIGMTWRQVDRWRATPQIFSGIATLGPSRVVRVDGVAAERPTSVRSMSPDLIGMLGVAPKLGRAFVPDDLTSGADVVLLAEGFWRTHLGADPRVVGTPLRLDGRPHTIVGVMPTTMRWHVGGPDVIGWTPLDESSTRQDGGRPFVDAIARLRPGMSIDRAKVEMQQLLDREELGKPAGRRYDADLEPLDSRLSYDNQQQTRRALVALLGAVGFVLLIACANVANLVLTRALGRQREITVRAALGATRGRLLRQFLTEALVLMAFGALGALLLASWIVKAIPVFVPDRLGLFEANPVTIDGRTWAFGAIAMAITVALCGIVPAVRASRVDLVTGFEGSTRVSGPSRGGRKLRIVLQASQVALTLVLLAGAGLLVTSFVRMSLTAAGYDVDRLVTARLTLPETAYPSMLRCADPPADGSATMASLCELGERARTVQAAQFFENAMARIGRAPGLRAAYGQPPPEGGGGRLTPYRRERERFESAPLLEIYSVDPDYFAVAGIPLKAGRLLGEIDHSTSEPVGVIDEHAAAVYWPGQSPIGQRFRSDPYMPWTTVVGVVGHVKTEQFANERGTIQAYVPLSQDRPDTSRALIVRTDADPDQAMDAIRSAARAVDASVDVSEVSRVADLYESTFVEPRFFLVLMALFAGLALMTASIGLYGIVSYAVGQRTREIGVRIALGADMRRVQGLVLREALVPVGMGIMAGVVASLWLTRVLKSLLYEITPHDPVTFASVIALLVTIAGIAAYIPARRATRIDPVSTLRAE